MKTKSLIACAALRAAPLRKTKFSIRPTTYALHTPPSPFTVPRHAHNNDKPHTPTTPRPPPPPPIPAVPRSLFLFFQVGARPVPDSRSLKLESGTNHRV